MNVRHETSKLRQEMAKNPSAAELQQRSKVEKQSSAYLTKFTPQRGQKRIVDHFVRYPYPTNIITNYKKEYREKGGKVAAGHYTKEEAFNLEKEHKIINPHGMEKSTTAKSGYQPFKVVPQ